MANGTISRQREHEFMAVRAYAFRGSGDGGVLSGIRLDRVVQRFSPAEDARGTPAGMAALMKEDTERWRGAIRAAGVKPE